MAEPKKLTKNDQPIVNSQGNHPLKQLLSQSFDNTTSVNAMSKNYNKALHHNLNNFSQEESSSAQEGNAAAAQQLNKKLQAQIKDLQQNLVLNKEILNRLLSNADANEALLVIIKEMTTKNNALQEQVSVLSSDKESLQTFAQQQAEDFKKQIKDLQLNSVAESEMSFMKEQIMMLKKKVADKEYQCIKQDNEIKKKKKELEKLKSLLEDNRVTSGMNKSFDIYHNNKNMDFDELINNSIDLITTKIQNKHNKSRDRSPSVPKLDFKNVKEFQEQDWLSYSKKLEESIKILNQRIFYLEDENDKLTQKYHRLALNNTKLYELNEKLNQTLKELKTKMKEIQKTFKERAKRQKECSFCNNMVEMSMSNFTMTYDKVNVSFDTSLINNSFQNSKNSFMKGKEQQQYYETKGSNMGTNQSYQENQMMMQRNNQPIYTNQELHELINDYSKNSKIEPSDGLDGQDIQVNDDNFSSKPKILKDSSKYIKKKSGKISQPNPINNIMQSVQEGLSQILNPSQTFTGDNQGVVGQNQAKLSNQTPTFNNNALPGNSSNPALLQQQQQQQHMPKIAGVALKEVSSVKNQKLQQQFMNKKASRNQFDQYQEQQIQQQVIQQIPDQQLIMAREESDDIAYQKQQQMQLQEQFKRYYVNPQNSAQNQVKNINMVDPKNMRAGGVQRSNSDIKNNLHGMNQAQYSSSGQASSSQKSQQNSKERQKQPIAGFEEKTKLTRGKRQSVTNRNSPTNQISQNSNGSSQQSNMIGNFLNVFDRRKRN